MSGLSAPTAPLSYRRLAMLRAVAAGRAEMTLSREPDLYVDGLPCCDQSEARMLAHDGLISPGQAAARGRMQARLTDAGTALLGLTPA